MDHYSSDDLPLRSLIQHPRQKRSVARVHAILDGAVAVLLSSGTAGFNTNKVAAVSQVPVGSIYQYFPNKQALLSGVLERGVLHSKALMWAVLEQGRGHPLRVTVEVGLGGLVDLLLPHRSLIAALMGGAAVVGPESALESLETILTDLARAWLEGNGHHDLDRSALYVTLRGGIFTFVKWIIEQPRHVPREEFLKSLSAHVADGLERAVL